jgi:DNA-directed RNA polymerase specialized sigma24 family protein
MADPDSSIEALAEHAFGLIRKGGRDREQGFALLCKRLNGRLMAYFRKRRVQDTDAEDLVIETWVKLANSRFEGRTRAIVWIWYCARSVFLSWVVKKDPLRNVVAPSPGDDDGRDDEEWDVPGDPGTGVNFPGWARLCVQRAAAQFEHDHPGRARVLRMKAEGWSADEIAVYFGAKPPPSENEKTAARNRVLHSLKEAREYFAHCKDES